MPATIFRLGNHFYFTTFLLYFVVFCCFDVVIIVTVAVVVVVSTAFQFSFVSNLLFLFCFYHLFVSSKVTIKQLVMMNAGPTHQPTNSMAR